MEVVLEECKNREVRGVQAAGEAEGEGGRGRGRGRGGAALDRGSKISTRACYDMYV